MEEKRYTCCICGGEFTGWGNNPEPVVNRPNARCCDECNSNVVLLARLLQIYGKGVSCNK